MVLWLSTEVANIAERPHLAHGLIFLGFYTILKCSELVTNIYKSRNFTVEYLEFGNLMKSLKVGVLRSYMCSSL